MRSPLTPFSAAISPVVAHLVGAPRWVARQLRRAQRPAAIACWAWLTVLIAWDVLLAIDDIEGNTWSEVIRAAGHAYPVVPFMLAALVGHLFHPFDGPPLRIPRAVARVVLTLLIFGYAVAGVSDVALPGTSLGHMLGGLLAGAILWPAPRKEAWQW